MVERGDGDVVFVTSEVVCDSTGSRSPPTSTSKSGLEGSPDRRGRGLRATAFVWALFVSPPLFHRAGHDLDRGRGEDRRRCLGSLGPAASTAGRRAGSTPPLAVERGGRSTPCGTNIDPDRSPARGTRAPGRPSGIMTTNNPPGLGRHRTSTGHLEELRVDPIGLMGRVRAECGDVGQFRLADKEVVLLTGAEANEFFFRAPEEDTRPGRGLSVHDAHLRRGGGVRRAARAAARDAPQPGPAGQVHAGPRGDHRGRGRPGWSPRGGSGARSTSSTGSPS